MPEPLRPASGRKLLLGVLLIAVVAIAAIWLYRNRDLPSPALPPPPIIAGAPTVQPPSAPAAPPPLTRTQLLIATAAASDAYTDGEPAPAANPPLIGRRFKLSLPFACDGPAPADPSAWAVWDYGPERKTIKVTVRAEDWTQTGFARELGAPDEVEAVEGFWIRRPWSMSEACPARKDDPLDAAPPAPSPQTVGLASLFGKDGSRVARRGGRPYEVVIKAPEDGRPPAPKGLRLALAGRITGFPGGQAVRCRGASPDQRPVCLIGVAVEAVSILDPATGEILGEWKN